MMGEPSRSTLLTVARHHSAGSGRLFLADAHELVQLLVFRTLVKRAEQPRLVTVRLRLRLRLRDRVRVRARVRARDQG